MKNKKLLLYMANGDISKLNKAPSRRMKAIYDNFKKLNIDFYFIGGNRKNRMKKSLHILFSSQIYKIDMVYIESSNSGLLFSEMILLLFLKIKKIPISVFIRDSYPFYRAYWNFKYPKMIVSNIFWLASYLFYRMIVFKMYFPSEIMMKKFFFKFKDILQPGVTIRNNKLKETENFLIFYAGGIGQQYDIQTFLNACKKIYLLKKNIRVLIYCRFREVDNIKKWENEKWISIQHKNLEELDIQPNLGIIPLKNIKYSEIVFPVKLLDYISLGLPIISSDALTLKNYIEKKNIGFVVKSESIEGYYNKILTMIEDKKKYNHFKKNVKEMKQSKEITWLTKCNKILNDFTEYRI